MHVISCNGISYGLFFFAIRDYLAAEFYLTINIVILIIVENFIVLLFTIASDIQRSYIMMLSNGNIFRVTSLCVESTGHP